MKMPTGAKIVNKLAAAMIATMDVKAALASHQIGPMGNTAQLAPQSGTHVIRIARRIKRLYPLLEAPVIPDMLLNSRLLKDCLSHSSRIKRLAMTNLTFS